MIKVGEYYKCLSDYPYTISTWIKPAITKDTLKSPGPLGFPKKIKVYKDGVLQKRANDYILSGNTICFDSTPNAYDFLAIVYSPDNDLLVAKIIKVTFNKIRYEYVNEGILRIISKKDFYKHFKKIPNIKAKLLYENSSK